MSTPDQQAEEAMTPPALVLQLVQACRQQGLDDAGAAITTLSFLMEAIGFAVHLGAVDANGATDEAKRVALARDLAESLIQIPQHPGLVAILESKRAAQKDGQQ